VAAVSTLHATRPMGEVHRAEDIDIGRSVAIKRLLPNATGAPALARFVDEVRICGGLDHPSVVPIHDVGVDEQLARLAVR